MHGLEDNLPDVHDEADFDIPDTQAVLERFMTHMSKQADVEYQALSDLLDSLPDPSSFTTAKSMTAAAAREKGVIPEADEETLLHQAWNPSQTNLRSVVYTMYILYISIVYTWYTQCICNVLTSEFNLLLLCCWQWPAATTTALCLARHMLGDSWE
jgi:hypothetical protein